MGPPAPSRSSTQNEPSDRLHAVQPFEGECNARRSAREDGHRDDGPLGRSPLAVPRPHLMEFAASLPSALKLRRAQPKRILKAAMRGLLPDAILDHPKMGFGVPLHRWFRDELRSLPGEMLLDPGSRTTAYIRRETVQRMIRDYQDGRADHALRLWVLLGLECWHREAVEAPPLQLAYGDSLDPNVITQAPSSVTD